MKRLFLLLPLLLVNASAVSAQQVKPINLKCEHVIKEPFPLVLREDLGHVSYQLPGQGVDCANALFSRSYVSWSEVLPVSRQNINYRLDRITGRLMISSKAS